MRFTCLAVIPISLASNDVGVTNTTAIVKLESEVGGRGSIELTGLSMEEANGFVLGRKYNVEFSAVAPTSGNEGDFNIHGNAFTREMLAETVAESIRRVSENMGVATETSDERVRRETLANRNPETNTGQIISGTPNPTGVGTKNSTTNIPSGGATTQNGVVTDATQRN